MRRTDAGTQIVDAASEPIAAEILCGFVVLEASGLPICANAEALRIFTHPDLSSTKLTTGVARRIRAALVEWGAPTAISSENIVQRVISGKRKYSCRVFTLDSFDRAKPDGFIGVLLERNEPSAWLPKVAAEFGLTPRERQAVGLLGQGLTSGQMADRMGVSPNTIKAFLRVIMIKMQVSSRSSILSKVLAARAGDGPNRFWPARPGSSPKTLRRTSS